MSDLPSHSLFQQQHARPKTGEELEVLGKTAASKWLTGSSKTLSEAVVETVKHAHLSPEQVKRVCEFANTDAFIREFKKESSAGHKVVDFQGGPADPAAVLQDLNDGGGGSVFDAGNGDYRDVPTEKRAEGNITEEAALAQMFAPGERATIPFEQPLADVLDMRDKLAGLQDHLSAELSGLETMTEDLSDMLYREVKQAALAGFSLGEISQVMEQGCSDADVMKVAFQVMTPRLLREGVFTDIHAALGSMDKVAHARMANQHHPIAKLASEFSDVLRRAAHVRAAREEVKTAHTQATGFLKAAGKEGILLSGAKKIRDAAHKAAPHAGEAAGKAVGKLIHEDAGKKTKKIVEHAVRNAPTIAGAAAVLEAGRRASNDPTLNKAYHTAQGHLNPMSQDWDYETYRQQGGQ